MDRTDLLDRLCAALPEGSACGDNLEYDPAFLALDQAAAARAERVVGDSVLAAEEPDWDRVGEQALALLQRTRDLRVAVHLATAWSRQQGWAGWADGLCLVQGLLQQQWAGVHPQLDAEDDDDPTARVNAVLALADPLGALGRLRMLPFVQSPRLGRFALRELRLAEGMMKGATESSPLPGLDEIDACCLDCPLEMLAASAEAAQRSLQAARVIDQVLGEQLGPAAPDLKPLLDDLATLDRYLQPRWQARSGSQASAGEHAASPESGSAEPVSARNPRIESADDVRRRLDEICEYYARCEPSSPVPLLLQRARRLVGGDFLALLRDLAPGGMDEMERVVGRSE
ncbi:type VI secretion system protein TssA [Stenotrophomonas maltophilia]|nr:type VI secretion system protein TssA [Stenotrophomonas maltophilia]MBH1602081.1 type VI secretion system protein TssA [Stenotrophomonas maltophilia]